MNAAGPLPTVFSVIEKIVSGAQKMCSASEKRVWVTPTVFNTTKNVVLIVQTKFKTAGNIVSATSTAVSAFEKIFSRP
jgi:hypothetical protein